MVGRIAKADPVAIHPCGSRARATHRAALPASGALARPEALGVANTSAISRDAHSGASGGTCKPLAKIQRLDDKCAKLAPVQPGAT
jgi:hypothetical protein